MRHLSLPRFLIAGLTLVGFLGLTVGCDLDPANENNPTEEQTLSTAEGIRALAVGMQESYATDALNATIPRGVGITSREIAINNTFSNLVEMEAGGENLSTSNANVEAFWSNNYRVVGIAEDLIENAPQVSLAAGTQSGIVATSQVFKALALANVALAFEQAPTTTDRAGSASFVSRQEVLQESIALLSDALTTLNNTAPSTDFASNILSITVTGGDASRVEGLRNLIHAYQARLNLLAGNDQAAIDASNRVDPEVQVTFSYNDQSQNPFWQEFVQSGDLKPRENLGSDLIDPDDARIDFFTDPSDETSTPNGLEIEAPAGFFATASTSVPLFVPDEMILIRAEAKLNQGSPLSEVVSTIDSVRTDLGPAPYGITAGLQPYSQTGRPTTEAALRTEILRQRRAELYLQGLALADSRRLGPEVGDQENPSFSERARNFYPYPDQESRNNTNTPANPDF
jgi:hypothetical protein